jgi:sugar phosphate isomerase/epimerase
MKFGLLSAIFAEYSFEQVIDYASQNGLECVELACWPEGKSERRYAGVTHIDADDLSEEKISYIKEYCKNKNVEISSLGYYPNPLDPDIEKRNIYVNHIEKLIDASSALDINMVTTFIGRDSSKTVEENLAMLPEVWKPILNYAEKKNVKIAIENCPMLFTLDEWPGGKNLMTSPAIWEKVFDILDSENLGLNFDPSHFVWQQMDYIKPIYAFKNKMFHIHFKDIKLYPDKLDNVGVMAAPLEYMSPKIPGLGDIKWDKFVSALTDIGYNGHAVIEIEDKAFESSQEDILKAINQSIRYLKQFV